MTPEQLATIQARADAATEGPWVIDSADPTSRESVVSTADNRPWGWVEVAQSLSPDAEFIANARTDVPALLALVREQQAAIERAKAACDRVIDNTDGHKPAGPPHPSREQATAVRIRAALTATEGA